jgi:Glu-tRNA(Gln) amidotransferase subunit E-like FAD-binding protein
MTLELLEAEVTRLEDIREIEDLERKYGYYFDTRRVRDVLDLFSENTESVEIESHGQYFG